MHYALIKYFILFIAGIINDMLYTQYTVDVVNQCIWRATVVSGLITLVNFFLYNTVIRESLAESYISIGFYAFGNIIGTYFILIRDKRERKHGHVL